MEKDFGPNIPLNGKQPWMEDNNNNRFIVQVISNIEQDYWHTSMLVKSSSNGTIIHFVGGIFIWANLF